MTIASGLSTGHPVDAPPPETWAEADLVRRVCLGLDIAARAITIIGPDGFRDDDEPEGSFGPDKLAAESAMLLYVASSVRHHAGIGERIDRVAGLLAPGVRSERTRIAIALNPAICLQLGMPHVLLSRLDRGDPQLDRLIELSASSTAHHGNEVVAHRALERLWLESLRTRDAQDEQFIQASSDSVLNHPVDLLWGSREDAYAHTHGLMYYTDFGNADRSLPRSRSDILRESEALLARALLLEDYDLTAEVLMAWPLTSAPWSATAAFGLRVLAELEDEVGFLPAKNGTPEKFHRLTGAERTRYALAASYHTAYVWAMVCAMSLRPGLIPPAEVPGPANDAEQVEELLSASPPVDTPWRRTFDRLPATQQRRLASFLLDMGLLANARKHDYPVVASLLSSAARDGLADGPLWTQAGELLQRVAESANLTPGN
jgi:hypothetical protein